MNLQIALILIGIAVVVAIYLYSRWESGWLGASDSESRPSRTNHEEPSFTGDSDADRDGDFDADSGAYITSGVPSPDSNQAHPLADFQEVDRAPLSSAAFDDPDPDSDVLTDTIVFEVEDRAEAEAEAEASKTPVLSVSSVVDSFDDTPPDTDPGSADAPGVLHHPVDVVDPSEDWGDREHDNLLESGRLDEVDSTRTDSTFEEGWSDRVEGSNQNEHEHELEISSGDDDIPLLDARIDDQGLVEDDDPLLEQISDGSNASVVFDLAEGEDEAPVQIGEVAGGPPEQQPDSWSAESISGRTIEPEPRATDQAVDEPVAASDDGSSDESTDQLLDDRADEPVTEAHVNPGDGQPEPAAAGDERPSEHLAITSDSLSAEAQEVALRTGASDLPSGNDIVAGESYDETVTDPDDDVHDEDQDGFLEDHPSLKAFIGSMNPLDKIRGTIQQKLDAVKAEREGTTPPKRDKPDVGPVDTADDSRDQESGGRKWWRGGRGGGGQTDLLEGLDSAEADSDDTSSKRAVSQGKTRAEPMFGVDPDPASATGDRSWTEEAVPDAAASDGLESASRATEVAPAQQPEVEQQPEAVAESSRINAVPSSAASDGDTILPADGFEKLSQIDYYVKLSGDRDVSRESVLAVYRESAGGLSKMHSIYGLRLPDKVWRDLENEPEESRFGDLVITLQLADQDGPVSEHDMTRFSSLVMKLSETTGRGFAFMAPIERAHEQALAIERFRRQFDSIFVVNIRPLEDETFEGPVIDRCATQIGLTQDSNGFYARYKPVGKQKVCLYSLANMSDTGEFDMDNLKAVRTRGVTFFTRPAVNRSPGAVFAEMVDAAKAFASRIKGEVIAPGYDDLSTDDVEAIRRSIEIVAKQMEDHGFNPGSEEATRLF